MALINTTTSAIIVIVVSILAFGFGVLAIGLYMFYVHSKNEVVEELTEVYRRRIEARFEAEARRNQAIKSQRLEEVTKFLSDFVISMTSIELYDDVVNASASASASDKESDRTIPNGIEDTGNDKYTAEKTIYPVLNDDASKLLKAVHDNPCAICLDAFKLDDAIIFCSNKISPHCFHQECSLDYLVSHNKGVQAPCPLCRKPFMGTHHHEQKILLSRPSELSLSDLPEAKEAGISTSHPSSRFTRSNCIY